MSFDEMRAQCGSPGRVTWWKAYSCKASGWQECTQVVRNRKESSEPGANSIREMVGDEVRDLEWPGKDLDIILERHHHGFASIITRCLMTLRPAPPRPALPLSTLSMWHNRHLSFKALLLPHSLPI